MTQATGGSRMTVSRILREESLQPFRLQGQEFQEAQGPGVESSVLQVGPRQTRTSSTLPAQNIPQESLFSSVSVKM